MGWDFEIIANKRNIDKMKVYAGVQLTNSSGTCKS
jgi:hypothetical protein